MCIRDRLYDCQIDPQLRSTMTYLPDDGGEPAGVSFIIPRSHADLVHRRKAMRIWAAVSYTHLDVYKRQSPD